MTDYMICEIFSSGRATLCRYPSDHTVHCWDFLMNFQSKNDQEGSCNVVINSIERIKSSIILCIVIVDTQYFFPNSRYLLLYLENCRYLLTHCFIFSRFFRFPGTLRVPPSIQTSILGKNPVFWAVNHAQRFLWKISTCRFFSVLYISQVIYVW